MNMDMDKTFASLLVISFVSFYAYKTYKKYKADQEINHIIKKSHDNIDKLHNNVYDQINFINTLHNVNLDTKITYDTDLLTHDDKIILELNFLEKSFDIKILNFIMDTGINLKSIEYMLIKRFLSEKVNMICSYKNIYFVNINNDVHFHIINKSQNKGDIVFTYNEKGTFIKMIE